MIFKGIVNILTVTNLSLVSELSHKLLSIIFLAKKYIKMLLKKIGKFFVIIVNNKLLNLVNIIEN